MVKPIARCRRCGHQMYPSFIDGYYAQCFNCEEDFCSFENAIDENADLDSDIYIRDWYMATYPTDELGNDINPEAVFTSYRDDYPLSLFDILDLRRDVYEYIGVGDSLIRERCFTKLAEIMGVDYDYVYQQWRDGYDARRGDIAIDKNKPCKIVIEYYDN